MALTSFPYGCLTNSGAFEPGVIMSVKVVEGALSLTILTSQCNAEAAVE